MQESYTSRTLGKHMLMSSNVLLMHPWKWCSVVNGVMLWNVIIVILLLARPLEVTKFIFFILWWHYSVIKLLHCVRLQMWRFDEVRHLRCFLFISIACLQMWRYDDKQRTYLFCVFGYVLMDCESCHMKDVLMGVYCRIYLLYYYEDDNDDFYY